MYATREWFGEWFDSPYYHILYKNRDFEEARAFINSLDKLLDFNPKHKILDLACGKGRHSIYLNSKGLDVVGVDLSPQNILEARKYENDKLHFYVHDMRKVFRKEGFDFVLNLFTSFGYFQTEEENEKAICATTQAIKPGGHFVLDFLNPGTVINKLVPCEEKYLDGILFKISRKFKEGYILKDIEFKAEGKEFFFQERVQAIRKEKFMAYFKKAGLSLKQVFGDYDLRPFEEEVSKRMIFLLQKPIAK